ncbi:uncharacterized protein [Rutidosis leptorrhynchoides]|uniref:uncharacterized protein n=1 Tax=Rutidosis leptorrhynchoides TaxID=125765 RepID=UPI003A9A4AA0
MVPYPKALKKDRLAAQYKKFQEMMKNVSVNLPITDMLKGMPNYDRFIKELISKGFGESEVFNALADLGASINLMPHSLYKRLSLGPLKPTRIRIRLANHSFDTAISIIEDILFSIDTLVFPVDFGIMEMKEDVQVPLILGRPFLVTADTIFLLEKLLKVDTSEFDQTCDNEIMDLEADFRELMNVNVDEFESENENTREESFEYIPHEDRFRIKSSWEEPPTLELKELPEHLEYAYLKEANQLSVIISSRLTQDQKTRLVSLLKFHHKAIAWKTTDIPGINPSYCTHKILMKKNFKPVAQRQRRLNPNMKEVVKKEVIKLLDPKRVGPRWS